MYNKHWRHTLLKEQIMTIVYALVARQRAVLAEHTTSSGNFLTVTRVLLAKIDSSSDSKMSYVYDSHIFHYVVDSGIIFLCMATEDTKRRVTFDFLEEIKALWRQSYSTVEQTALAFSLNDAFAPVLSAKMAYYSDTPDSGNIAMVQKRLDSVKEVMIENIDKVLDRGEKIELLVDKTEALNQSAYKFEKQSRNLQKDMWYRGLRNQLIIGFVLFLIVLFSMVLACGVTFQKCVVLVNSSVYTLEHGLEDSWT